RVPAIVGILAVACHSLVVAHSFEARFYGPWLLCAAFFAWSVSLPGGHRRNVNIGVASMLLTTVHWYGVVSLGIMCAAVVLMDRARWRDGVRLLAPAGAGLLALV